ncbi:GrpE nucleotide exchange factor [Dillenia turbinata]|uniref:GrpE nucleotide exchange factor n=1 Tax=Dillenia turbinata TaxID=194707 RepID=A0AAN8W3N0_9MAGN
MITSNPISVRPSSMAFSLSSPSSSSSLSSSFSSSSISSAIVHSIIVSGAAFPKLSKTLKLKSLSLQPHKSKLGYSLSISSPCTRCFKPLVAVTAEDSSDAVLSGDAKTVSGIEAMIDVVEKEKNELVQKITSGKEKFIRLQADFDNFRTRIEKEKLTVRSDAQGEVVEALLPMVDNFERAKQQLGPETEKEKKIDASYQGIYKQFVNIMRSLRVAALHEAIACEESQEHKGGVIIEEFQRGFLLGDRLLRPAMVKVLAGPGRMKASVDNETSTGQPATAAGVDGG